MDDLISRRAAIDAVKDRYYKYGRFAKIEELAGVIERLPTAQPVIRCKDCGKREVCRTSTVWAVAPDDDWFCADAERRTDDR